MKSTQFADLNTIKAAVDKAVVAASPVPAAAGTSSGPIIHRPIQVDKSRPTCNRGKMVLMTLKINRKYHPEMFLPNGNPRLDVGNFGSL